MNILKKNFLLVSFLFLILSVCIGCGASESDRHLPREWASGMYSVSPNGKWVAVIEESEDSKDRTIVLVDMEGVGFARPLEGELPSSQEIYFSPNSEYLLYKVRDSWHIHHITTNTTITRTIIGNTDTPFFLPNSSLAIVTKDSEASNETVSSDENLDGGEPDQLQTTSDSSIDSYRVFFIDPSTPSLIEQSLSNLDERRFTTFLRGGQSCLKTSTAHVVISEGGEVSAFGSQEQLNHIAVLSPGLSRRITELISSQRSPYALWLEQFLLGLDYEIFVRIFLQQRFPETESDVIDEMTSQILESGDREQRIKTTIKLLEPDKSSEEIEKEYEVMLSDVQETEQESDSFSFKFFQNILVLSPDGTKLLFAQISNLTQEELDKHIETLNEVDIESWIVGVSFPISTQLYLIDLIEASEPIILTHYQLNEFSTLGLNQSLLYFGFSQNGEHIVFETFEGGESTQEKVLYLAQADSAQTSMIEIARNNYESPCWH